MFKKLLNKILIVICVLVFVIFAPILLFYVSGFKYDLEKQKIIKTGGLFLSFWPDSADVYIDGSLKKKHYHLDMLTGLRQVFQEENLLPGTHKVKISLKKYGDWEKEIIIDESKVTTIENILLLPDKFESNKLTDFKNSLIKNLAISPSEKNLIFLRTDKTDNQNKLPENPELWQIDLKTLKSKIVLEKNTIKSLLKSKNDSGDIDINEITWSPDESMILFRISYSNDSSAEWAIVDIALKQVKILDEIDKKNTTVRDAVNENIIDPSWTLNGNKLLFIKNNSLFLSDLSAANSATNPLLSNITSYKVRENYIYFTQKNILYRANLTDLIDKNYHLAILSNNFSIANNSGIFTKILISPNNDIFVLDAKNTLYYLNENKSFESLRDNVTDFRLSPNNEMLAFSTQYEIWSYYLKNNPAMKKNKNTRELIVRYNDTVPEFNWLADSAHLIFLISNQIKIAEIDNRDYRQTLNLAGLNQVNEFIHKNENDSIYYISQDNNIYLTEIKQH